MAGSAPRAAPESESAVDIATGILLASRTCTPDEAFALLSDAAVGYDMNVSDLARCPIADQELR